MKTLQNKEAAYKHEAPYTIFAVGVNVETSDVKVFEIDSSTSLAKTFRNDGLFPYTYHAEFDNEKEANKEAELLQFENDFIETMPDSQYNLEYEKIKNKLY